MQRGFSLVELSIVLVILGLLTGGILSGQSLIRAAELRAVSGEYTRWVTATQTFRDKYFSIPGDMANAVKFWGAADGSTGMTAACFSTQGTGTQTCNGNGNGRINYGELNYSMENYRYWQHLANAGLIEGTFSGVAANDPIPNNSTRYSLIGTNIPRSKLSNGGYYVHYAGTVTDPTSTYWVGTYDHLLVFGGQEANDITEANILKPEESWNIDVKLDDGRPAFGKVRLPRVGTCATTIVAADAATAEYAVSNSNIACYIFMSMGL